jgi:hypothetical protein
MKYPVIFLISYLFLAYNAYGEKRDSATISINNKDYVFNVGDTLELGYGANTDGSFMFILDSRQIGLSKLYSSKKVVIKKIRYNKFTKSYEFIIRGKGIYHAAYVPQAFEKKEIISVNGVKF